MSQDERKELKTYLDEKLKFEMEERRAELAFNEAMEAEECLKDEQDEVRFATRQVQKLKLAKLGPAAVSGPRVIVPLASNPFESLDFLSKFAKAPMWGAKEKKQVTLHAGMAETTLATIQQV